LIAPNPFHKERVRARFLARIQKLADEVLGRRVQLQLDLEGAAPDEANPASDEAELASHVAEVEEVSCEAVRTSQSARRVAASGFRLGQRSRTVEPPKDLGTPGEPVPARTPLKVSAERARPAADEAPAQLALPATFDTFVVGSSNALAREASLAVAEGRHVTANPLYLVGGTGTGKSHLARALVSEAKRRGNGRTVYCSAEAFTSQLTQSIRKQETSGFRRRFRNECRLLVIEDVQFLGGKTATQLELFHTMEHLQHAGGRIVLTADRLPREIPKFDRRLVSQMTGGLVADLVAPDRELRREILRIKAARGGIRIPDDCLELLVNSARGSVRDLEGALIQLVASASLLGKRIDYALTEAALRKIVAPATGRLSVADVIDCVCSFFGVDEAKLRSQSRARGVLVPRQLAMYLCHRYTDASFSEIGRHLGRNHPAVSNAIEKVEREMLERAPLRYQVEELVARLGRD
jgi:chromosomal replication initiator protein